MIGFELPGSHLSSPPFSPSLPLSLSFSFSLLFFHSSHLSQLFFLFCCYNLHHKQIYQQQQQQKQQQQQLQKNSTNKKINSHIIPLPPPDTHTHTHTHTHHTRDTTPHNISRLSFPVKQPSLPHKVVDGGAAVPPSLEGDKMGARSSLHINGRAGWLEDGQAGRQAGIALHLCCCCSAL